MTMLTLIFFYNPSNTFFHYFINFPETNPLVKVYYSRSTCYKRGAARDGLFSHELFDDRL